MQRIELFDSQYGGVFDLVGFAVGLQIVVDFSRTEDDPLGIFFGHALVINDRPKFTFAEFSDFRDTFFMPQEALWRHDDERLFKLPLHLTPENMEQLCRGGQITDLNIVFGAGLKEALEAGGGVFGALAFIAVG